MRSVRKATVAVAAAAFAVACGSGAGPAPVKVSSGSAEDAAAICTSAIGSLNAHTRQIDALVDAQATSVAGIAEWRQAIARQGNMGVPGPLQNEEKEAAPTDPRAFCIYTGTFYTPLPPGVPEHTAGAFVVDEAGNTRLVATGQPDNLRAHSPEGVKRAESAK